ncbi:hypothetical protein KW796_01540 [Candidatus Parcubacteria bacterium]|nr:hypothetical protein [Candidatus Parcubacteria bacterium]
MEIIPAILEKNEEDFINAVAFLPPEVKFVHVDVLEDDVWAPIERDFEAHLMVEDPEEIFDIWKERGAKRIIAHKILPKTEGMEVGLGLEMHIPITDEVFGADFVHLMSIAKIGEQGHPLDERIFDRIREVKERFPGKIISVDGGINISNYEKLIEAGADRLVVGSGFKELWTLQMKK